MIRPKIGAQPFRLLSARLSAQLVPAAAPDRVRAVGFLRRWIEQAEREELPVVAKKSESRNAA